MTSDEGVRNSPVGQDNVKKNQMDILMLNMNKTEIII